MPSSDVVRLALLQHACGPEPRANLDKTVKMIRDAASRGAQVVATQELFASVYFPQTEDEDHFALADPVPGPTSQLMGELARELGIEIIASVFEKRAPGLFHNTCIMIDAGGQMVGRYRKMHVPDDPRFYEKFYFTPGDACNNTGGQLDSAGWQICRARCVTVGLLICWDQWFPEAARLNALRGAQILFYPSAIGWISEDPPAARGPQRRAWQTVQQAHAITNGVFVSAINRVGTEGDIAFWGRSFVVDPFGEVIAEADEHSEQVLIADCDLSRIDAARQSWPFLRDRRIDAYADLTQRYVGSEHRAR